MNVQLHSDTWQIKRTRPAATGRRAATATLPSQFLAAGVSVAEVIEATAPVAVRRSGELPVMDFTVTPDPGAACVVAVRHPSGALTFHFGEAAPVGGARRGKKVAAGAAVRFRIVSRGDDLTEARAPGARRGLLKKALTFVILKVATKLVDAALPRLVLAFEQRSWAKRGLSEGWFHVTRESLAAGKLEPRVPAASVERSLLLLHGTFSHAVGAFGELAGTDFFPRIAPLYGDRVYAFNHFTLSRTPEENARALLAALPAGTQTFDVITHSRGGLVLRNLVERRAALGADAPRFALGHGILVGVPNDGTPLATPTRWEETVGWVANVLELFPANPWTTAAEWVAEVLVWLAWRVSGGCPGLQAMDSAGGLLAALQQPPGPPAAAYSALVANYHPTGNIAARMLDVGVDSFFGSANDLVTPTEGGWRVDRDGANHVAAERIGCYGPGGNLAARDIQHLNFFSQPETVNFLVRALAREPLGIPPLDPTRPLPDRRFRRAGSEAPAVAAVPAFSLAPMAAPAAAPSLAAAALAAEASDAFHLMVLPPSAATDPNQPGKAPAQLLAMYRGARVLEKFELRGGTAGQRFRKIIAMNERIRSYVNGAGATLPSDDELLHYGEVLFDTLFPTAIRRLYDVARSDERAARLNVIFTSMISWIADKPWEFAFDRARGAFLATEEIQFVRNVLTAVPAQRIPPRAGRLRILVAVAQPFGSAPLSVDEEIAVIRRGFEPLIEAGMVEIEVLAKATPASLHGYIDTGRFDVVHFIGHGEFDPKTNRGYLLFEDGRGAATKVDDRSLREIFCQRDIRVVFLNACETGQGGRADFNRGVAPALVAGGVPVVVANQYKVLDLSATTFAQHLYWALAQGMSVGKAARESRIAVNYSLAGESIDWAVPVVYARDPGLRVCAPPPAQRGPSVLPQTTRRARSATADHARRVAVWDVDHLFPELEPTLDRMSAAQTRFGFLPVDLSAPLGTWQLAGAAGRQRTY
ncbi:MAG: CHAT domain-containing protein, partial [Opitutaceae bacterium]|nr:CHAT domain-containing protein [Opitutaceae bacterium]